MAATPAPSISPSINPSSTAVSGATGAPVQAAGTIGDFYFKSASGASAAGGGISPVMLAALAVAALVAWNALRK
jgi:hypothetical protein